MRVLITAETFLPFVTGVARSVCHIATHCRDRGDQAIILAPGPGADSQEGAEVIRFPAVPAPIYPAFRIALPSPRRIGWVLDAFEPDVVHLASPLVLGGAVACLARRRRIPTVAVFQTDYAGFLGHYHLRILQPLVWTWLRAVHRQADLTLASSIASAAELRANGIVPSGCWGRGVDRDAFSPTKSSRFRGALGAEGKLLVGYAGRLGREKKLEMLRAICALPDVELVLIGDGPDRRRLERILRSTHFVGHLSGHQLTEAMASLDAFVHTGTNETFCQAVQEAQSCGVPVIVPDRGGAQDLVQHEVTGLIFEADNMADLLRCITVLRERDLRIRIGLAGRVAVGGKTWQHLCEELFAHYAEAVGQNHA